MAPSGTAQLGGKQTPGSSGGNVGRDEPDRAAKVGQIRRPGRDDDGQFGESGPQRLAHRIGARCSAKPARRRVHQQRIAEQRSRPSQRVRGGGLGQAEPLGSPAHVRFVQQRIHDHEQVEVDAAELHHMNGMP